MEKTFIIIGCIIAGIFLFRILHAVLWRVLLLLIVIGFIIYILHG